MSYIIQFSDHPEAWKTPCSEEASKSWVLYYDGSAIVAEDARRIADILFRRHQCVRVFKGNRTLGELWYERHGT